MNASSKKRILISAYACSPVRGSEPGVGWGFVASICKEYELDVIVEEEKFREEIEFWIRKNPDHPAAHIRFHFIRKRRNRFLRKLWPPSYYWYYREWHAAAAELARRLDDERDFDLIHQLTMVGFREPGYLWQFDKPFVWGPIGGAGFFPWRFLHKVGIRGSIYYLGYNAYNYLQVRFSSRPRLAARRAGNALLVATQENSRAAETFWGCSSRILSEIGIGGHFEPKLVERSSCEPLKIIWSGHFTPGKALNLALEATSSLPEKCEWELHILGSGVLDSKMKSLARKLGIANRCHFYGWVDREEAFQIVSEGHVALITSLRDLTSTVVVEALEMGLPVIAPSHCGFVDAVTANCGILVPASTPQELKSAIASAIEELGNDEPRRKELARGAKERAKEFYWEAKGKALKEIYEARMTEDKRERERF